MQTIAFSTARANLAELLHGVETAQEALQISRRGQAAAVLMSLTQYRQLSGANANFTSRLAQWRSTHAQDLDDTELFVRDTSSGRDFSW